MPVLNEGDYTYIATYTMDSLTGPDIMIVKYDGLKSVEWEQTWSGAGFNRDQPSDMVMDDDYLYICGASFSSSANYNYVVMKIDKNDGTISWVNTYNGSASNYDVATGLVSYGDYIYVTGASFTSTSMTNYHTRCYKKAAGTFEWEMDFDYDNKMDIPFDISVDSAHSFIVVTGASQSSAVDWDYQTVSYDTLGALQDQSRISGSGAGFDRALVVKSDDEGNVYISGSTVTNGDADDMKTVKLNPNGSLAWVETYGNGQVDIAYDLVVDIEKNVYVCGESYGTTQDFFVIKYDSSGSTLWTRRVDGYNNDDVAYKMCLGDGQKGVYVTGKGFNNQTETFDFLTVAYNDEGDELWRDYYDGPFHGNDEARNIIADTLGNVFVTGQQEESSGNSTVTIKYRTDFFTEPPSVDSPSVAYMFYPNEGQLLDSEDSLITDSTHYYMLHHNPQLFFGYGVMNMVFSHVDQDTATTDTLHRVDVSFLNSTNETEAYPVNENDSIGYLNYYLGHCPYGITANGNQKLLFSDIYDEIDAEYSSNNAGLKLTFIVNPGSTDINEMGLKFEGHTSITVLNNWQLRVTTPLGTYDFEKPKVYQLDGSNNIETLPWHLNWVVQNGNEAVFSACGSFDNEKPLIIEISRAVSIPNAATDNMEYSTYYGSSGWDEILASDNLGDDVINGGFSTSISLPRLTGSNSSTVSFQPNDGFLFKMKEYSGVIAWGTFYGGRDNDKITDLVLDDGAVYVCGFTYSDNLPQNSVATYVTLQDGGSINQNVNSLYSDNFISRFNYISGQLVWANYIGSSDDEDVNCTISFDTGNLKVYLAGTTKGADLNLLTNTGAANVYNQSNFNGGSHDGYILRLTRNGVLEWSTYFGSGSNDFVKDIECVNVGPVTTAVTKIYISGTTTATDYDLTNVCNAPPTSGDFPNCNLTSGTQYAPGGNGWLDAFIVEFNDNLEMEWSTMIGGTGDERVNSHSLTGYETTVFLGINSVSSNTNFPALATCTNCFNQAFSVDNPFIAKFDSRLISWSTFYGTGNTDYLGSLKVFENELYICGGSDMRTTASTANYCLTPNAGELPLCPGPSGYYFDPDYYYVPGTPSGSGDAFLALFNESNQLTWATLVKGNYLDRAWDMAVGLDFMFLTGTTWSAFITSTTQDYPQEFLAGAYNQNASAGNVEGFVSRFTLDHTTGISDVLSSELIASVFPNPTNSRLVLKAKHGINKFQYSMLNLLGQTVKSKTQVFSNYTEIDCSMLSAGSYFLIVQSENLISTHKIIKQ